MASTSFNKVLQLQDGHGFVRPGPGADGGAPVGALDLIQPVPAVHNVRARNQAFRVNVKFDGVVVFSKGVLLSDRNVASREVADVFADDRQQPRNCDQSANGLRRCGQTG